MKPFFVWGTLCCLALPALAVDHDNIDAQRPLDFDDAETIAFHEKSLEWGSTLVNPRNGPSGIAGDAEFLYGFAKNWQLNLGADPQYAAFHSDKRRFSAGDVSVGVLHNFNRETERTPAFGLRADASLPTGRNSSGLDLRLRGIASRKMGAYGRLHLNLDLGINNSRQDGERKLQPAAIVGYSRPLGYPTRFDRTLAAQVSYRAAPDNGESGLLNVGIGVRQQVTPRSVFDIGVKSDIAGDKQSRETFWLIAGYSTAF